MRMHSLKKYFFIFIGILGIHSGANADWQLNQDNSSLYFVSTKNSHISETHQFTALQGQIDQQGNVTVDVLLHSVETLIPIRNERMQTFLFEVDEFPNAQLIAKLPKVVMALDNGDHALFVLDASVTISGTSAPYKLSLMVSKSSEGHLSATTVAPMMVSAATHGLIPGIEKLQQLAGLANISFTVPVTFSVTFTPIN